MVKNQGEAYRNSLIEKVRSLKLEHNVFFYNKYLELKELLHFLEATDIYLALSQNPDQAVSGTLSYALGSGRPVVSTPFAQAKEDVTGEVGMLADFTNVSEISSAITALIADEAGRQKKGMSAYFRTRGRTWDNVILGYMSEYIRIAPSLGEVEKNLPHIKLSHLYALTDHFGMIQFAKLTVPDPASGYTTDDTARALIALVGYYEKTQKKEALSRIETYVRFLEHVEQKRGGFHNYVGIDRAIPQDQHMKENLETTSTRALYALAKTAVAIHLPEHVRDMARALFLRHRHIADTVVSPRSIAYVIKALTAWSLGPHTTDSDSYQSADIRASLERCANTLASFYERTSVPEWKWFEDILAYSNAVMPDALMDAYGLTGDQRYLTIARQSLDFLIAYSFEGDVCVPVGQNGWLRRGGVKQRYDQQPEEVAVLVFALKSIYRITGDEKYNKLRRAAFNWFLGNNTLHQLVYDQLTGGCYDGVGEKEINLNQGAESTVMYLLARLSFE